ncbi:MAG: hypothetical protein WHT08_03085 [Bryobacteraceae bacterium]
MSRQIFLLFPLILPWASAQQVSEHSIASSRPARRWVTTLQTGFADTFQLTLGGVSGDGPAWQNRFTTGVAHLFVAGDLLSVHGWNTTDTPSGANNTIAGLSYRAPVWKRGSQTLALGSGLQYWNFPAVLTGTTDWLIPGNLVYTARAGPLPVTATSDSWTLLASRLPKGSLVHTQGWIDHPLARSDAFFLTFRHGPAHTYSWGFYGTQGHRVVRYQTALVLAWKETQLEAGWRQQWGLQRGIPDNRYWHFSLSRNFSR